MHDHGADWETARDLWIAEYESLAADDRAAFSADYSAAENEHQDLDEREQLRGLMIYAAHKAVRQGPAQRTWDLLCDTIAALMQADVDRLKELVKLEELWNLE